MNSLTIHQNAISDNNSSSSNEDEKEIKEITHALKGLSVEEKINYLEGRSRRIENIHPTNLKTSFAFCEWISEEIKRLYKQQMNQIPSITDESGIIIAFSKRDLSLKNEIWTNKQRPWYYP